MLTYWQVRVNYCFDRASTDSLYNFKTKKEAVDFYNNYKVDYYETLYEPEKKYILFENEIGTAKINKYVLVNGNYEYRDTIDIKFPTSILGNRNKIVDYCKNALKRYNEWSNDKAHPNWPDIKYVLELNTGEVFDFKTNKLI